jgi:hypothetical protein
LILILFKTIGVVEEFFFYPTPSVRIYDIFVFLKVEY